MQDNASVTIGENSIISAPPHVKLLYGSELETFKNRKLF